MKIITYNFKNTRDFFMNKVLKKRIDSSVRMFKEYLPDIIGMQEINKKVLGIYKNVLTDYIIIGSSRHSFGLSNEYNPLYLKRDSVILVDSKTYSLSESITNLGEKIPNSLYPRICVVAHIIYNKEKYLVINTHLDHQSDIIRKLELKILNKIIKLEKKDNEYLIVIGDFNVNKCDYLCEFLLKNDLVISNINCISNTEKQIHTQLCTHVHYSRNSYIFLGQTCQF